VKSSRRREIVALAKCPEEACGKLVSMKAEFCPHCGCPLDAAVLTPVGGTSGPAEPPVGGLSATDDTPLANVPPAVRILPMDSKKEEFVGWTAERVQAQFFLGDLLTRPHPGRYCYREAGLDAEPGTVVLFQFASQIIARAILACVEPFRQPDGPYHGAFCFEPASIRIFEPVGEKVVQAIWPKVRKLGNVRWKLDPSRYADFIQQLRGVRAPVLST
jgi:hypothetical protein